MRCLLTFLQHALQSKFIRITAQHSLCLSPRTSNQTQKKKKNLTKTDKTKQTFSDIGGKSNNVLRYVYGQDNRDL